MVDNEQLYQKWLEHRRKVDVPENMPENVMTAIKQSEPSENAFRHQVIEFQYFDHPLTRWATALGLVLLGLFRILYVSSSLLRTNLVMP